jgi:hypothetical protein
MNAAHWHLVLTHVPVVGTLLAFLALAASLVMKDEGAKRLSLGALVVVAFLALPTYFTGEPAEGIVDRLPGVSERVIDEHEDAATLSLVAVEVVGAAALAGLIWSLRAPRVPAWFVTAVLLLALVSGTLMAWTANLGGQIRHPEIRTSVQSFPADQEATRASRVQSGGEKDD